MKFVVVFLGFLASVYSQSRPAQLRLTAKPQNVVNRTTESLEVSCKPPAVDESVNYIVLLHLQRISENANTPTVVASERSTGTVLNVKDNRTTADGSLSGEGGSFLTVNIANPQIEDTGVYQCRFAYLNLEAFEVKVLTKEINVTFSEPDEEVILPPSEENCECEEIWSEVKILKETLLAENRALKQQLRAYNDSCRVSFSAKLSSRDGIDFASNQVVKFAATSSNKGNAFDISASQFVAPCNGQYFFSLTLRTVQDNDSGYVDGVIEVDGVPQARTSVFTDSISDHYEQASNSVVLTLEQGNKVQVRIQTNSDGRIYGDVFSVFSGFYVSP